MKCEVIKVKGREVSYVLKKSNVNTDEVILFLHGWGQSKECFLNIIKKLDLKKDIMAIDLPGFGESPEFDEEALKSDYITKYYASFITDLLEEFDYKKVNLVSHSFGARLSFWLAKENNKINKLLLTGAAGIKPKRKLTYYLRVYGFKFQKLLLKTPLYFQYKNDILKNSGSADYKNASEFMKKVLIKTVNEDLKFLFKDIKQKTILFWGEQDDATPLADGKIMNKEIPNSKLIVVKGTHYAFLENEELFLDKIKEM